MRRRFMNKVGEIKELPYLTIEALEDGLTAKLSTNACQYSTDCVTWTDLAAGTATSAINTGEKLYFKATGLTPKPNFGIGTFTVNKQFNLLGNCMSMLFGDEAESNFDLTGKNYAFYKLFYNCTTLMSVSSGFLPATTLANWCYRTMFCNCTGLKTAPALPAKTLSNYCYCDMFNKCINLTTAPALPAKILADYCYSSMFYNCTGLTIAPALSATTLASNCYRYMFSYCSSLIIAPDLPVMSLASGCYNSMFYGCTELTTAPKLPATTLATYCYSHMFYGCSKLTTAPALPATILKDYCYEYMFYDCSKLNYIKAMFTTTPSSSYTNNWVSGVASTGTFVKNADATWNVVGNHGIPTGWTVDNHYNYIDLGLPSGLKWATCNVGASKPEEYGDYFAWGETTIKSEYTTVNSLTFGLSISELQSQGIVDGNGNLTPSHDAATANWGGTWRMPTKEELVELNNECTWIQTTQNGINCYKVTGPNGNSIFLPAAGWCTGSLIDSTGVAGLYWSSTPYEIDGYGAYFLGFGINGYVVEYNLRDYGLSIRPVLE